MATISEHIEQLKIDKQTLVDNLVEKGVEATSEETFTTLVPKVKGIETGGGDEELEASFISSIDDSLGANVTKLPDELTSIRISAFQNCTKLALTELPSGLTSIGINAFYQCSNLALTKLPSGLTNIGNYAFQNCTSLALTELPSGLTNIGNDVFASCTSLALTKLPSGLTNIGANAFQFCSKLALTELPSGLTNIGNNAFASCTSLALTELPSGLTNIGSRTFRNCTNLALTELPDELKNIGTNAFQNCSNITIKEIPAKINTIHDYAFDGCTSLTELNIMPSGNNYLIRSNAFQNCTNLAKVTFPNATRIPPVMGDIFPNTPIASGTGYIYVPDDLVDSLKNDGVWSIYANQIKPISDLDNLIDLSNQEFPITLDAGLEVTYDATTTSLIFNGTITEGCGFNIPLAQELIGSYTLSYTPVETSRPFYISIDNISDTALNGWGGNEKTFTLTEQPTQLMFWFDYSSSSLEQNVYDNYTIKLKLIKND